MAIPAVELVRPLLPRLGPASIPPAAVISLKLDKLLTLKLLKMKQKSIRYYRHTMAANVY